MIDEARANLHKIIVERYRQGEISIGVNKNSALLLYSRMSPNPMIKIFHFFIQVYSHPLTILGTVFTSVFIDRYLYLLFYLFGLFGLMALEEHLSKVTTIQTALVNQNAFSMLLRRGVINVRDIVNPDLTV